MSVDTSPDGLETKSTAPAERASTVDWAPSVVCAETITTGRGCSRMIWRTASTPLITGMFTSMVTTSGRISPALATASRPSLASPTTSKRPSRRSSRVMTARMKVESSTTITRILRSMLPVIASALAPRRR